MERKTAERVMVELSPIDATGKPLRRKVISATMPPYPADLIKSNVAGSIAVRLTVQPDGSVTEATVLGEPSTSLAIVVRNAVLKWKFAPLERDEEPKVQRVQIELNFHIVD